MKHGSLELSFLDLVSGGFDSEAYDTPNEPIMTMPDADDTTYTPPETTGARSEVAIERELGIGDRHLQPDELASRAIESRDYDAQRSIARDLYGSARCGILSDTERAAAHTLLEPQRSAGVDVSAYMKTNMGPGYSKESFGIALRTDGPSGPYHSSSVGVEQNVDLGALNLKVYGETSYRSDRGSSDVVGMKLERELGPATIGVDLNTNGAKIYGKLESPPLNLGMGAQTRVGVEASASFSGNGEARMLAEHAIQDDINHRRSAERMGEYWKLGLPYDCRR